MKDLPQFKPQDRKQVEIFITRVLTLPGGDLTHLSELITYPDGHFRAIFNPSYFVLPAGQPEPSKSQWNSLKKKVKRHDSRAFVFKEHGTVPCNGAKCYYLDFGFFAE